MTRRMILCASFFVLCLGLQASTATAQNWEFRTDLGGWLDKDTGLVWGDSTDTFTILRYGNQANCTWEGAQWLVLEYRVYTGFSDWRLPTRTEALTAVSHGLGVIYPDQYHLPEWTSDQKGNSAYIYYPGYPGVIELYRKTSAIGAIFVRNSVPPPPTKPGKNK